MAAQAGDPPSATLQALLTDEHLGEVSGIVASRRHPGIFWVHNDGDNAAELYAIDAEGQLRATLQVAGVRNVDWEDLASFELNGRHYLLIADTGDNGGIRKTLSLHVVEEPQDIVKPGQDIEVKILRVDIEDRKIGLSLKRAQWATEDEEGGDKAEAEHQRGGLDSHAHLGTDRIDMSIFRSKAKAPKPAKADAVSPNPENQQETTGSDDNPADVQ